jgi:hypothetical protein
MKAESDSKGEGTDTQNLSEYKDETHFVIEIQKGFDPTSLDLAQNTFGEFIAELDKKNVQEIKEYRDIVSKFVDQQLQISKFGELRNLVNEISRTDADEKDRCERLSADLIEQLSIQIENENAKKKENKNAERDGFLTPDQIDYLLRNTRYLVKDKSVRAQIRRDYVKNTNNHLNIVNAICLSNK